MKTKKKDHLYRIYQSANLDFFSVDDSTGMEMPFVESPVSAGFPSPAEDYMEIKLDLNKALIAHPAATFYVRVKGESMKNAGINDGDILIVDRALEPKNKDVVVCILDGEFTVKRIRRFGGNLFLDPENPAYKAIKITEENEFTVWGVVSYVIHKP